MKCEQVRALLAALCEGSLDGARAGDMEIHLNACGECRRARQEMAQTLRALRSFERIEPSRDFSERLWERIDRMEVPLRALWFAAVAAFLYRNRRVFATACAVFVISLLGGIFTLQHFTEEPQMAPAARSLAAGAALENYVIREIPQPIGVSDTVVTEFVTGTRPHSANPPSDTYVYKPVVSTVSVNGGTF